MEIFARERSIQETLLDPFFDIPVNAENGLGEARKQLTGRTFLREDLYEALKAYNHSIGNDVANLEELKDPGKYCVVTGQQLGFMGGPAYLVLKGISCLLLAREADAIPIFWLATEDHDIHEIDHTYLIDEKGNLREYHLEFPKNHRVEELVLDPKHLETIESFLTEVGMEQTWPGSRSYSKYMASFLAKIFAGTGIVFLEPKILRPFAKDFFKSEIKHSTEISDILKRTTLDLEKQGSVPQIKIEETHLFFNTDKGIRLKIKKEGAAFKIGQETYTQEQILKLIENETDRFSVNVAARPVLQSLLLPTLAYVAGPNEMQYYQQLRDYHHFYDIKMPWIVRRLSATFVSAELDTYLKALKLSPWDEFPQNWNHFFANEQEARSKLEEIKVPYTALHQLRNELYPHQELQERVLNWCYLQSQSKQNLVHAMLEKANWRMKNQHLYCYL